MVESRRAKQEEEEEDKSLADDLDDLITFFSCVLAFLCDRSVGRSDGPSVRPSVDKLLFLNAKNGQFSLRKSLGQSSFDIAKCA